MKKTTIIAEAGVNHNGSLKKAIKLIDIAAKSGADIIKFQSFTAENVVTRNAKKANYQKISTVKDESQLQMLKKLELNLKSHKKIISHCKKVGIEFLSSPFDNESISLLKKLRVKRFKVPSGEINNLPYLRKIGKIGKPVILSTGMSSINEIKKAIKILTNSGTKKKLITVLHCNTDYPTKYQDVNLKAMLAIKEKLNVNIGYSDHTLGIEIPIAAVAMGATIIEKHFTLDKNSSGPDHKSSLNPKELKKMILSIRKIETSLGNGKKIPTNSELKNLIIVRKSIRASKNILKGEFFSEKNITVKRPANGISPMKWDKIIGKRSLKNYKIDDPIQ